MTIGEARETRIVSHEQKPSEDEARDYMRAQFDKLMKRAPVAMVLTIEDASGKAATAAVGPPAGLETLARLGVAQVMDMLSRKTGESG